MSNLSNLEQRLEDKLARLKQQQAELIAKIEDVNRANPSRGTSAVGGGCAAYITFVIALGLGGLGFLGIIFGGEFGAPQLIAVGFLFMIIAVLLFVVAFKSYRRSNKAMDASLDIVVLKKDLKKIEEEIVNTRKTLGYQ